MLLIFRGGLVDGGSEPGGDDAGRNGDDANADDADDGCQRFAAGYELLD